VEFEHYRSNNVVVRHSFVCIAICYHRRSLPGNYTWWAVRYGRFLPHDAMLSAIYAAVVPSCVSRICTNNSIARSLCNSRTSCVQQQLYSHWSAQVYAMYCLCSINGLCSVVESHVFWTICACPLAVLMAIFVDIILQQNAGKYWYLP